MPQVFSEEDLSRTAHNLERLRSFLVARRSWRLPTGDESVLAATRESTEALVDTIDPMVSDTVAPSRRQDDLPGALPESELDGVRLRKFGVFLEQLRGWFGGHQGWAVPPGAEGAMCSIFHSLIDTRSAIEEILARSVADGGSREDDGAILSAEGATGAAPSEPEVLYPPDPDARLVVEDTQESPALQEFRGKIELTHEATNRLKAFLEENHVSFNSYEQHAFESKVVRWIGATPEGSVLVIKVSGLQGKMEPYPTYAPTEVDPPG